MSSDKKLIIPPPLSAQDRSSFAYKTIKDRLPVILVKVIDFLHRQRKELHKFGGTLTEPTDEQIGDIESDAKLVISHLTKLRKELETNKAVELFEPLELDKPHEHFNEDIELWNLALTENKLSDGSLPRWFDSAWLLVECYLYRKVKEMMLRTRHLKMFDPFVEQKQMSTRSSLAQMLLIANHVIEFQKTVEGSTDMNIPSARSEFNIFLKLSLWANKIDLSIGGMSADAVQSQHMKMSIRESLDSMDKNILSDHSSDVWYQLQKVIEQVRSRQKDADDEVVGDPIYIDVVCDNAGYEVFVDLCLLHFMTLLICGTKDTKIIKFRLHIKQMPWFVSDALLHDLEWLLKYMNQSDQQPALQTLGEKWKWYFVSRQWEIHDHKFWTLPYDYSLMQKKSGDLYAKLSKSSLIIFKGDLNYRKLTGDLRWHILTPFIAALRGFLPAPLVTLRTAKADVVVGIEDINLYARINNNELPRDWMISGDYGLIQYASN